MILGGAQENTLYTVRGLHDDPAYSVKLVTGPAEGPEGELLEDARTHGIEPIILHSLKRNIDPMKDLQAFFELYRYFCSHDFDMVHTHSSKAGILGRWAAYFAGVPHVLHTIHGLPFHRYQSRWRYGLFRLLEVATGAITEEILTVCDKMAEKASAAGVNPGAGFTTVYSGMDLDPFLDVPDLGSKEALRRKQAAGFDSDTFVFGKIARLFHLKGHKYALRAFSQVREQFPKARLMLVGNGILRDQLEDQCKNLGIRDDVRFMGLVPYQEIPDMLAAMDCLIHTSLREGLARVIPQAQAAGRPAISYDIDGAPEAIDDGETGFLVEPEAVDPFAEKMIEILRNSELRERMIDRARDWVQPKFDWRYMVSEIKSVYERYN
jgi:glycosyltransferase involved in cell wall biosynthesis